MTDIPIIFSAPMVNALLGGKKTMTRRLAWQNEFQGGARVLRPRASSWQRVKLGDRLWVREGLRICSIGPGTTRGVVYLADNPQTVRLISGSGGSGAGRNRPSIHCPRWASRLTLTVTAAKIERLQTISDADALAEGIEATAFWREDHPPSVCFSVLWNRLHGANSWNLNPEVVAVSFAVAQRNIDGEELLAS